MNCKLGVISDYFWTDNQQRLIYFAHNLNTILYFHVHKLNENEYLKNFNN